MNMLLLKIWMNQTDAAPEILANSPLNDEKMLCS